MTRCTGQEGDERERETGGRYFRKRSGGKMGRRNRRRISGIVCVRFL